MGAFIGIIVTIVTLLFAFYVRYRLQIGFMLLIRRGYKYAMRKKAENETRRY